MLGAQAPKLSRRHMAPSRELSAWPVTVLVAGFPIWWLMGLGAIIWSVAILPLGVLLLRSGDVRVPKGFGIWLLFLVWMLFSGIHIDSAGRMLGFVFRASQYVGVTVLFVYVYNVLRSRRATYVYGLLTTLLAIIVAGGLLGLLAPTLTIRTPLAYVMPGSLLSNSLVRDMVVVGTTQFNPDAWAYIAPRPSAPFLYTNNWGNAYSLLLPVVATYWLHLRASRLFLPVGLLLGVSVIPAVLTLNRGMFLGIGVAVLVLGVRHTLSGNVKVLLVMTGLAASAGLAVALLPVAERLDSRLDSSGTNFSRLTVYKETVQAVVSSPWFGYGAPRPTESTIVPLGTQGQFWMVLFSHGFVGVVLFMGALGLLAVTTMRRQDLLGMSLNASLIVLFVQAFYYGLLFQGLLIGGLLAAAALQSPCARAAVQEEPRT